MTDELDVELRALLADVEHAHGPVVLSRYGFEIISVNGKKYLQPRSLEAWAKSVADKSKGKVTYAQALASAENPTGPYCATGNTSCSPMNGCLRCEKVIEMTGWWCNCTYG